MVDEKQSQDITAYDVEKGFPTASSDQRTPGKPTSQTDCIENSSNSRMPTGPREPQELTLFQALWKVIRKALPEVPGILLTMVLAIFIGHELCYWYYREEHSLSWWEFAFAQMFGQVCAHAYRRLYAALSKISNQET